ncbi:uncharacterized protein LOC133497565 isoform X3 [Syngnathoides biaculeatus]|uniref:uncharacterized protein LOC133497565 isoform X3 n=1 Tax=Syngnathoides biaculeatus TaxID=300417 RepID=UPI002ADD8A1D|nr:uncharacterized protein LOC133497565 isoform X3 [Syngnathoides biaculeatus]
MCARTTPMDVEKLSRIKEERKQRQLLGAACKQPRVVLHRADVSEYLRPGQHEPELTHIKEEEEGPEPLHIKQELLETPTEPADVKEEQEEEITKFPLTGVSVKSEDDDGEHCGGSQARDLSAPRSACDDTTSHSSDYADGDERQHREDVD